MAVKEVCFVCGDELPKVKSFEEAMHLEEATEKAAAGAGISRDRMARLEVCKACYLIATGATPSRIDVEEERLPGGMVKFTLFETHEGRRVRAANATYARLEGMMFMKFLRLRCEQHGIKLSVTAVQPKGVN